MNGQRVPPFRRFSRNPKGHHLWVHVWRLVPSRHKAAFGFAALLMAINAACNTAIPLLLGRLVDGVKTQTDQGVLRKRSSAFADLSP